MSFYVSIRDSATPAAQRVIDSMGSTLRTRLHKRIGHGLVNLVRGHFLGLQATRHKTSEALGATPTNYWGKAAESVSQPEAMSADAEAAHLAIAVPGIRRAQEDIDIYPTEGRQYLTIPIASESYGNSILKGETTPRFEGGFFFTSKRGNLIYAIKEGKGRDATIHPLYVLKPHVHQEQDRTLLPSDDQIEESAQDSLKESLSELAAEETTEIHHREEEA